MPTSFDGAALSHAGATSTEAVGLPGRPDWIAEARRVPGAGLHLKRLFIDVADYDHQNMGDLAMLQAALRRFKALSPTATLSVLTRSPERLGRHCPDAIPVPVEGRNQWFAEHEPFHRAWMLLPSRWSDAAQRMKARFRWSRPGVLASALRASRRHGGLDTADLDVFLHELYGAQALVVTGAGGVTDHARTWAGRTLDLLDIAARRGVPTAMFGHGLGPLTNTALIERTRLVMPQISLLALREGRFGPAIAASLGVPVSRTVVTGDDALELVVDAHAGGGSDALGVNVRLSPSSGLGTDDVEPIRSALRAFLRLRRPRVLPVPIAFNERLVVSAGRPVFSDTRSLRILLEGMTEVSDFGEGITSPSELLERIGQTRAVVTGAYHAAVFALGLGVPAVCLAGSAYFEQKFLGLEHQFGDGVWVVRVDGGCEARLSVALAEAWDRSAGLRDDLRARARRQVEAGRAAYRSFAAPTPPAGE